MTAERMHDRLPWYVSGTLGENESREFAEHLAGCEACSKEQSVLESMKRELEKHGDDLLRDHPPPERLAALIEGADEPLSAEEAARVRRHLALCATCAEESSWLRGESVAGIAAPERAAAPARDAAARRGAAAEVPPAAFARRSPWLGIAALAAATLIAALLIVKSWRGPEPALIARYQSLSATQLGAGGTTLVAEAGETTVRISLEPDFATAAFPLTLEIQGSDGRSELRKDGIRADDLSGGRLYLEIPRRVLPDGDHVLRLSSPSGAEPPEEFPFHLEARARP